MVHHSRCPLCKNDQIIPFARCTDYLVSKEEFQLCRCSECTFVFTQDYPEESEIEKYYDSEEYISHTDSRRTAFEKAYHLVRRIMLKRKISLMMRTSRLKTGTILDIGSGTGHFLSAVRDKRWKITGIESSQKARDYSLRELGVEVLPPEKITSIPAKSFDCITMWHVLEHFHDPFTYLTEVIRLLKPGGKCIIALPNCSSADAIHYNRNWAAFDVPRHLWHFTPVTFNLFISAAGLKIKIVRRLPFDVFYISVLSEKNKGSRFNLFTGMLKGLWFSFQTLFSRGKCSSLIYILVPVEPAVPS